jgi:hypothetical protein
MPTAKIFPMTRMICIVEHLALFFLALLLNWNSATKQILDINIFFTFEKADINVTCKIMLPPPRAGTIEKIKGRQKNP